MRKVFPTVLVLLVFSGCATHYEKSADREVAPILKEYAAKVDRERARETPAGVIEVKEGGPDAKVGELKAAEGEVRVIDLKEALELAFSNSRDFKSQKESLYLSVLSYTLTTHSYSWRPSGAISGDVTVSGNGSDDTLTSAGADATLTLARTLLSGGAFFASGSVSQSGTVDGPGGDSNSSSVRASFTQPLLAGAGMAARETMVLAERGLVQDVRSFELFRQDLAIRVITSYYGLLRQRQFIESATKRVEQSTFLYERSKALFVKGTGTKVDEFRAEQDKLDAENDLVLQQQSYDLALDEFKIFLGLQTDTPIDVADEDIEPEIIEVNLVEATRTAFENRLDFQTDRERLEDVERQVEIARNALLPELEFFASAGVGSESGAKLFDYRADDGSVSAGLSLTLPLDKKSERNAYKSALISMERQRRSFALAEDNVKLDVRNSVRRLKQAEVSVAIQEKQLKLAEDRLEVALIKLDRGEIGNRDVVEAQTQLQNAKNNLVQAQVSYLIESITVRRNIGTLRVDERGGWR